MLKLKPVSEAQASDELRSIYADIKQTCNVPIVPLLFQYIGNFEKYLTYMWGQAKQNITSDYFRSSYEQAIAFTRSAVGEIYTPSSQMMRFLSQLQDVEKQHIAQTVSQLEEVNAKLLILTIGLREGVKGVVIGQQLLQREYSVSRSEFADAFAQETFQATTQEQQGDIASMSRMLAPIFGSQAIAISQYPAFFSNIAGEMNSLLRKDDFLQKRVELERIGMRAVDGMQYPLGCSYQEIMTYAYGVPHLNELIYILAETFPTQFPRLLITSGVMHKSLGLNPSAIMQQ